MKYFFILFLLFSPLLGADYIIGEDPTFYPYNFEEKTAAVTGYLEALIQEISQKEKIEIELIQIGSLSLLNFVSNKELDGALTTLSSSHENRDAYDFSTPLLKLGPLLVVRKNSKVSNLGQLKGKIVGISPFDNSVFIVQKYPSIMMRPFTTYPTALRSLMKGEIDGVLLPALGAHALVNSFQFGGALKIVTSPLNEEGIRLLSRKENAEDLITPFNRALKLFNKNGFQKNLQQEFEIF